MLDLSQQLPGPYATFLLAALGAEVTKIEPPAGDAARQLDPEMFEHVNAGKTSVVLDLKTNRGQRRLHELVHGRDVFIEGFRPGVTSRLGCDTATLHTIHPQLIYCSITGVGQTGPLAGRPTHDLSLQAMAGVLTGAGDLSRIGVPWVDLATGTSAALAITAAWHTGQGCHLDMSMLDAAIAWARVKPSGLQADPEPTYGTLRTADGKRVTIALLEDAMWVRLCTALGWADWATDPSLARYLDRRQHADEIRNRLERDIARLTRQEIVALAERHDLPLGPADAATEPVAREQITTRFPDGPGRDHLPLPTALLNHLNPAPSLGSTEEPPHQ